MIPYKVLIANVNHNELSDSTESGPAPCDRKCCSEHAPDPLFACVGAWVWARDYNCTLNLQAPLSQTVPHVVINRDWMQVAKK